VLRTPGADARHRFDIASLHLRGPVDLVVNRYREFSAWLAARGFHGPVWVTEHGYPADANFQVDPAYAGGAQAQAAYLTQSLVTVSVFGALGAMGVYLARFALARHFNTPELADYAALCA
jgi:hypothetical protein